MVWGMVLQYVSRLKLDGRPVTSAAQAPLHPRRPLERRIVRLEIDLFCHPFSLNDLRAIADS
jgi:hypothetical protein